MEEQDLVSGKVPNDCNCGRGDWVYDSDVGMWCCGCGYVKHATGKGFKDGRYRLDSKRRVVKSSNAAAQPTPAENSTDTPTP